MDAVKRWGPAVISTLVLVIIGFRDLIADGTFDLTDKYAFAIAFVNAVLTWLVPNLTEGVSRYVKPITHAALVGLAFFLKAHTGDGAINPVEWIDGLVLMLGALGIVVTVGPRWRATEAEPAGTASLPPPRR